jgi:hypothetical protein
MLDLLKRGHHRALWCQISLTDDAPKSDKNVPTDTARKIAAALIEAADEIDGLT